VGSLLRSPRLASPLGGPKPALHFPVGGCRLRRPVSPSVRPASSPSFWFHHSLGVGLYFRVSRTRLAAHRFTAPAPTFGLSTVVPAVFTGFASRSLLRSRCAPLVHSHLSLGAPGLPPCLPRFRSWKGPSARPAPLLRFAAPSALEDRSVHSSRPCLSRYVPTSPFLTASPVSSASLPPGISPGGTRGVSLSLQGSSRSGGKLAVTGVLLPS
jgi:hypothetical protein